jgi:predicted secreted protein
MSPITWGAIYLTVWWTVLFAILPIGVVSHYEAGIDKGDGGDPGAPVDPKLKRKFFTTSWVAAVICFLFWVAFHFHLLHLPNLPGGAS